MAQSKKQKQAAAERRKAKRVAEEAEAKRLAEADDEAADEPIDWRKAVADVTIEELEEEIRARKEKAKRRRKEVEVVADKDQRGAAGDGDDGSKEVREKQKKNNKKEGRFEPLEKDDSEDGKDESTRKPAQGKKGQEGVPRDVEELGDGEEDFTSHDSRVMHGMEPLFKKAPTFEDDLDQAPEPFLQYFETARKDALGLVSRNKTMVDKVLLRKVKTAIPTESRAGAWLAQWEAECGDGQGESWLRFVKAFRGEFLSAQRRLGWNMQFQTRTLKAGESPIQFLAALRKLATMAGKNEEDILAAFLVGLSDQLKDKLSVIKFERVREAVETAESAWKTMQAISGTPTALAAIDRSKASSSSSSRDLSNIKCYECEKFGHMAKDCKDLKGRSGRRGPTRPKFCDFCKKGGHDEESCWYKGDKKSDKKKKKEKEKKRKKFNAKKTGKDKGKSKEKDKKKEESNSDSDGESSTADDSDNDGTSSSMKTISSSGRLPFASVSIGGAIIEACIDSAATEGAFVDGPTGDKMAWVREPKKEADLVGGFGGGGSARCGEAEIMVGGARGIFKVGVTDDLNGKVSCLLGNDVMKEFEVMHDCGRMTFKPKGGAEVGFEMRKVKNSAHVAFLTKPMTLMPGEGAWLSVKGPRSTKDGLVHVEATTTTRGIEALDGVSIIRDGKVYVPIKNFGEKKETLKEGEAVAKFTIVKEVEGKKGMLVHKGLRWPSDDPKKEAKEREEGEAREAQRKLVTDEEFDEHLKKKHAHLNAAEVEFIKNELLIPFRDIFVRKGEKPLKPIFYEYAKIRLDGGPKQAPLRHWSQEKEEAIEAEAAALRSAGILQKSKSPWRSEWVLVGKSDGTIRATTDFRDTVNKHTVFDAYPMARIDEQQRKMAGCDIYSTCDTASGYYHIGLDFASREATAVRVPHGLDEFTRTTMGGATSGSGFVRAVEETIMCNLGETRARTANYVDEFITGGKQNGEMKEGSSERIKAHVADMKKLFTAFQTYGWRISLAKLLLAAPEAVWVGAKFREGGVVFTDDVLQSITECREPKNVTEVRRFMGFCALFFETVPDFRVKTKQLTKLQGTKGKVKLDKAQKEAFEWVKEEARALRGKVRKLVERNKKVQLKVYSDASAIGIGAVVMQEGKFVGCNSRTLTKTEAAMSPIDREFLAAAENAEWVYRRYGCWPDWLYTDHEPLANSGWRKLSLEPAKGRAKERPKWAEVLERARTNLVYVQGLKNKSDAPSRPPFVGMSITATKGRSKEEWSAAQKEDPKLKKWFDYLEANELPKEKRDAKTMAIEKANYDIVEGVLRRRRVAHQFASRKEDRWLMIVPEKWKAEVLKEFHDESGHAAGAQLSHLIHSGGMDWERCYKDCCEYREACEICDKYKKIEGKEGMQEPMLKSDLDGKSILHIDWVGPLPTTKAGNKFILLSITKEDKWPELTVHKAQNSLGVIQHLDERAERESVWDIIINDRGQPFLSEATTTWLREAGVEQRPTTGYNPMANGDVEAEVLNMKEMIVVMCDGDPEWDLKKGKIAQLMRFKRRSDSTLSAYEQRRGKPMRLANHLKFGADEPRSLSATEQQKLMKEVYKREDKRAMKQKEAYDKKRKVPDYKEGDKVWARIHEPKTFGPKREGPFVVVEKVSELNYRLGEIGKTKLRRHPVVNVKHLAHYRAKVEDAPEAVVERVVSHRDTRRGPRFKIKWAGGDVTEEPIDSFVDVLDGGKRVWNEKLRTYARANKIPLVPN